MNTARPFAARARSASSDGWNPAGTPDSVSGVLAVRIVLRSGIMVLEEGRRLTGERLPQIYRHPGLVPGSTLRRGNSQRLMPPPCGSVDPGTSPG
ncbi:hypothetical protein WR25_01631 [Diploscapter pachys]|uniref:Uncharacterized protein n=1 Tax=Diploscapter pachys TaxID=2018661 RepID=A0A2A2K5B9_9BILA|nr:hypothetical protein WR25_01631 [Diploscapter pachys]